MPAVSSRAASGLGLLEPRRPLPLHFVKHSFQSISLYQGPLIVIRQMCSQVSADLYTLCHKLSPFIQFELVAVNPFERFRLIEGHNHGHAVLMGC
eukprot:5252776-Amphidinium_carterae.1